MRSGPANVRVIGALFAALVMGCGGGHDASATKRAPSIVTICGSVVSSDGSPDGSLRMVIRDARSGERFTVVTPAAVRESLDAKLGGQLGETLQGRSACATGSVRDSGDGAIVTVSDPGEIRVDSDR